MAGALTLNFQVLVIPLLFEECRERIVFFEFEPFFWGQLQVAKLVMVPYLEGDSFGAGARAAPPRSGEL